STPTLPRSWRRAAVTSRSSRPCSARAGASGTRRRAAGSTATSHRRAESGGPEGVHPPRRRAELAGDAEQPVVLDGPLGAARRSGLDLTRTHRHREVGDEGVLGLARAVRDDRAVAGGRGARHRRARLADRADLVQLDQDRIADALRDAAGEEAVVGHEDVVADELHPRAERRGEAAPAGPVVLPEAVLDRDDRVRRAPPLVETDQLVGRAPRAARLAKHVAVAVRELATRRL